MSTAARMPEADPLYARPLSERPVYATGMLLDAQDFADEQTYHRAQLARAMAFLAGGGPGGLRVTHQAGTTGAQRGTGGDSRRARPGGSIAWPLDRIAAPGLPAPVTLV